MGKPKMLGYQKPVPNNRADRRGRKNGFAKDIKVSSKKGAKP